MAQSKRLYERGYREFVLTGVDVGDYGKDLTPSATLAGLVGAVLRALPPDIRLRVTSIDPLEIDDALIETYAMDARLMPHWHLSVQAGDDMVLRRMARRHRRDDVLRVCRALREARPDTVFGADFIAGFPTETEAQFANTLDLVEAAGLTLLHVFPYSARQGTAAARLPQLDKAVRRERAGQLRDLGAHRFETTARSFVGRTVGAVVETERRARSDHYLPVHIGGDAPPGFHGSLRVEGHDAQGLIGRFDG